MNSQRRLGRRQIPLSLLTELRDSFCDLFPRVAAFGLTLGYFLASPTKYGSQT